MTEQGRGHGGSEASIRKGGCKQRVRLKGKSE